MALSPSAPSGTARHGLTSVGGTGFTGGNAPAPSGRPVWGVAAS